MVAVRIHEHTQNSDEPQLHNPTDADLVGETDWSEEGRSVPTMGIYTGIVHRANLRCQCFCEEAQFLLRDYEAHPSFGRLG